MTVAQRVAPASAPSVIGHHFIHRSARDSAHADPATRIGRHLGCFAGFPWGGMAGIDHSGRVPATLDVVLRDPPTGRDNPSVSGCKLSHEVSKHFQSSQTRFEKTSTARPQLPSRGVSPASGDFPRRRVLHQSQPACLARRES